MVHHFVYVSNEPCEFNIADYELEASEESFEEFNITDCESDVDETESSSESYEESSEESTDSDVQCETAKAKKQSTSWKAIQPERKASKKTPK